MTHMLVVDDDASVVNILKDIIAQHFEEVTLSTAMTGRAAVERIMGEQPDVVLLDYLLPDSDGLNVIRRVRDGANPAIVMISEVSDKQMIAKAYQERISFFITKPINVVEVVSVVGQVIESQKAFRTLKSFEHAIRLLNPSKQGGSGEDYTIEERALKKIYARLGILGMSGCDELIKAVLWAKRQRRDYALSEMYSALAVQDVLDEQTVKKRINRVIAKAFRVLATMGIEDPFNPVFEDYASQLFDYGELRAEMKLLEGVSDRPGKINIKQFVESSVVLIEG